MSISNSRNRQESARGDPVEQETDGYICKTGKQP